MSPVQVGIVWNPSKSEREELEAAITGAEGFQFSWFETTKEDPGQGAARQAIEAGAELVVAAGGDGTVRAVAEHLAEAGAQVELGIVPLGTGNLLARNLGIPLNHPAAAFERMFSAEGRPVDVGWIDVESDGDTQRHAFTVMAGFGIDAHMITETDDDLKEKAGWLAYVESLGRAVSASEVIDLELTDAEGDAVHERAHTLLVGNCGVLQGGITLLPDAEPDDGELDVLVLRAEGLGGWLDSLRNLVWDNGLKRLIAQGERAESSHSTSHWRTTGLSVTLAEPRVIEVDGDDIGESTRLTVSIQPGALRVR
ncbi:diacylglycerol/lipid kinase family protein [Arthrobacter sp. RAF14]|uniref:diacylglycerol/lipid kinase family protein n=1 Tax=Arthrobacter sp. RAF14 TaxID=3233051 RepID=UPI003F8FA600